MRCSRALLSPISAELLLSTSPTPWDMSCYPSSTLVPPLVLHKHVVREQTVSGYQFGFLSFPVMSWGEHPVCLQTWSAHTGFSKSTQPSTERSRGEIWVLCVGEPCYQSTHVCRFIFNFLRSLYNVSCRVSNCFSPNNKWLRAPFSLSLQSTCFYALFYKSFPLVWDISFWLSFSKLFTLGKKYYMQFEYL